MYKCEICKRNVLPNDTMTNICSSCEDKLMNDDYEEEELPIDLHDRDKILCWKRE